MQDNKLFGLTEEQIMMRESVQGLLERVLPREKIKEMDEAHEFPFEAYQAMADAGWMGLLYSEEYGGIGGSYKDFAVFIESVAYHNAQMASAYLTSVLYGGNHVFMGGSEELKQEFLPKIISGEKRMAFCLTEPDSGSDASSIKTRAVRVGDDYVITGSKLYITCAHVADQLVVVTKTDPDSGHRGITLFVVDTADPGVTIHPMNMLGRRMIRTNEVFFDNVRVPAARMLGEENKGWYNMMRGLNLERMVLAASAAGNMQKIVDYAADYARERVQFGQSIASFQAISHKLADMQIMTEGARTLTHRVADMLDAGLSPTMETAVAKVFATEKNVVCADMGIQILGGAGYTMDHDMQMFWRDSRVGPIGGGTSEIMRTVIAKQMNNA